MPRQNWLYLAAVILLSSTLVLTLAGCTKTQTAQTVVDTTPPAIPANLTRTTPDSVTTPTFNWDAATDDTGVAGYAVRIDSDGFNYIGDVTTYTVSNSLGSGTHTFEVMAVDEAGNCSTAAWWDRQSLHE